MARCGGLLATEGAIGLPLVGATDSSIATLRLETSTISSTRSEIVRRAIAFRISGSNSSVTTKSCTCSTIIFLAWIISWAVDGRTMKICVL